MSQMTSEERFALGMAARRYLRASENLATASEEFGDAADELRDRAIHLRRFVVDIDHRPWLIQIDKHGDLDAERIERL
jgi:hypothetical protein